MWQVQQANKNNGWSWHMSQAFWLRNVYKHNMVVRQDIQKLDIGAARTYLKMSNVLAQHLCLMSWTTTMLCLYLVWYKQGLHNIGHVRPGKQYISGVRTFPQIPLWCASGSKAMKTIAPVGMPCECSILSWIMRREIWKYGAFDELWRFPENSKNRDLPSQLQIRTIPNCFNR